MGHLLPRESSIKTGDNYFIRLPAFYSCHRKRQINEFSSTNPAPRQKQISQKSPSKKEEGGRSPPSPFFILHWPCKLSSFFCPRGLPLLCLHDLLLQLVDDPLFQAGNIGLGNAQQICHLFLCFFLLPKKAEAGLHNDSFSRTQL